MRGQSITEVLLIVALVAIAALGLTAAFGDEVRGLFAASADGLAGAQVERSAPPPRTARRTLKDFGKTHDLAGRGNGPE